MCINFDNIQRVKKKFHIALDNLINNYIYIYICVCVCVFFQNIKKKHYGSTVAFLADAKWILHNCIVFNGSKFFLYFYMMYSFVHIHFVIIFFLL